MYQLVAEREGHRRLLECAADAGVTPAVVKTLLNLDPETPTPMREIAEFFRCDPSYVTTLVDGLEDVGMAERQAHPGDRRVKVVALTDRGVEARAQVRKTLDQPPAWFSALSPAELAQLQALLTKLLAAQAEEVDSGD
jgi:DNA-binding MarR family transcriptional regulator